MQEKKLVSVIVPVYNVRKYLPRCVESILLQTYETFELILVDDGSQDGSGEICDHYAGKDPRVRVLHKANGGVSSARNMGIEQAGGEYITFIDSDDWVERNYLEKLVSLMSAAPVQMAVGMFDLRDLRVTAPKALGFQHLDFRNTNFADCCALFDNLAMWIICGKLFLRSMIREHDLRFDSQIKHGEDTLFLYEYLNHCDSLQLTSDPLYHYNRLAEASATRKYYEAYAEWKIQIMKAFEKLLRRIELRDGEKNALLARMAAVNFCGIAERAAAGMPRETSIAVISDSFMVFKERMFLDTAWKDMNGFSQELLQAIASGDMESVYAEQIRRTGKHRFKKAVKSRLRGFLSPIIQRKRDGLIPLYGSEYKRSQKMGLKK